MSRLAGLGVLVLLWLAAVAAAAAPGAVVACGPQDLRAAFRVVAGSAGAGSISYTVRLSNRGARACSVSGRPGLRLLGRHGARLPTAVVADRPGTGAAALIRVAPGATAIALARLSPDIPGKGEPVRGRCEPTAFRLRVSLASPGSGAVTGPVRPPTPVCQRGRIVEGLLHLARRAG
jgi:hypothetical protein